MGLAIVPNELTSVLWQLRRDAGDPNYYDDVDVIPCSDVIHDRCKWIGSDEAYERLHLWRDANIWSCAPVAVMLDEGVTQQDLIDVAKRAATDDDILDYLVLGYVRTSPVNREHVAEWIRDGWPDAATGMMEDIERFARPCVGRDRPSHYKVATYIAADRFDGFLGSLLSYREDPIDMLIGGDRPLNRIGDYANCMSWAPVTSMWTPLPGANPLIGTVGETSREPEIRLEMLVDGDDLGRVVRIIRDVHPYEEPEIDILPCLTADDVL